MSRSPNFTDWWRRFALALAAVALASAARSLIVLTFDVRLVYMPFFPAIIVAGLYGGLGTGLIAVVFATVAAQFGTMPSGTPPPFDRAAAIGLVTFVATGVIIAYVCSLVHRARRLAEDSDHQARSILASITDGFFTVDAEWRFTYLNPSGETLFGKSHRELAGRVLWEVFPQIVGVPLEEVYRRAARERAPIETEYLAPSGRYYAIRVFPESEGGLAIAFHDETERRRAEEKLKQSEAQFRNAIAGAPIPVILSAEDGAILMVSEEFVRVTGYRLEDLADFDSWLRLAYGPDAGEVAEKVRRRFANESGTEHGDYKIRTRDGVRRTWSFTVGPPGVLADGRRYLVAMVNDITDRERAEREKTELLAREREARGAAEHANRIKDEFLATLSHELRTPLQSILGWSQMLRRSSGDPMLASRGVEIIERNARAQTRLIEDLLDLSRIIAGKLRLEPQSVDSCEVARAAAEALRPEADAKNIHLTLALEPQVCRVSGDPARLQQVFWNLLSNAIKFTPRGGHVRLEVRRGGSTVEIRVEDDGEGIAPEFLPHVFERFRQADGSSSRKHAGLGVGLAIVHHLVDLHRGHAEVESAGIGKGTTFTVRLPVATPETPAGEGSPRVARTLDRQILSGVRALVVDDERDACDLIRHLLEHCGASVATAASADEALRLVEGFRPDVLVSDVGMPGRDGYDLIRDLRQGGKENGAGVPAIALTAFARAEDRARAVAAGYQSHVTKPVEAEALIATVALLTGRSASETDLDSASARRDG